MVKMKNEIGKQICIEYCKMCGITDKDDAEHIISESANIALEIDDQLHPRDSVTAVVAMITGVCLINLGMERTMIDWGWKDEESDTMIASTTTQNRLLRYILKTYPQKVKTDYEKAKFTSRDRSGN